MKEQLNRKLPITYDELVVCKSNAKKRIGAKVIDVFIEIIIVVLLLVVMYLQSTYNIHEEMLNNIPTYFTIYAITTFFLNLIVPVLTQGQTIGKLLVHTRIISIDGNMANLVIYLVRQSFFTVLAVLGQITILTEAMNTITLVVYFACFVQIFAESHGRTLQDMFAKTIVVDDGIYLEFRRRRFYELDHPLEFIQPEDESLYGSIINEEEFE